MFVAKHFATSWSHSHTASAQVPALEAVEKEGSNEKIDNEHYKLEEEKIIII